MPILVTGASGKLGLYLLREAASRGLKVVASSRTRPQPDFGHAFVASDLRELNLAEHRPQVVLHLGAMAAVGDCYQDPDEAFAINAHASARLAEQCQQLGARLIAVSTDMVFSGQSAPYSEESLPDAFSVYGRSKAAGEQAILAFPQHSVVRPALMIGPALGAAQSYYDHIVSQLGKNQTVSLFEDEWRSMISYAAVARGLLDLVARPLPGIFHLGGTRCSRYQLGQALAQQLGCPQLVRASLREQIASPEPRPRDLTLQCQRWHSHFPEWKTPQLLDTD